MHIQWFHITAIIHKQLNVIKLFPLYSSWINNHQTAFMRRQTWNHKDRFSEAVCPAWTSWPAGDRILIWDPVWAGWNSTAIPPPTPTHSRSIKRSDSWGSKGVCVWEGERQTERKRERLCVMVWEVDKNCACVCASTCTPACLCVWTPHPPGWLLLTASGWRFVTQSCSNGQSWARSEAKWTAFKAEISHHTSLSLSTP